MVYYTTYVVHTKIFFWDFDNDSYAQNSEIILTIRIQKNFFKIPIGKFFEKLSKSKKKNLCVPHMWYTIPHLWVKVTTYVVYYTTYVVYYTTNVYSPEIPILLNMKWNVNYLVFTQNGMEKLASNIEYSIEFNWLNTGWQSS